MSDVVDAIRVDREVVAAAVIQRVFEIERKFMREHPGYSFNSPTLAALGELREFAEFLRLTDEAELGAPKAPGEAA